MSSNLGNSMHIILQNIVCLPGENNKINKTSLRNAVTQKDILLLLCWGEIALQERIITLFLSSK